MTCERHLKEPIKGYSECVGCEIEDLLEEITTLKKTEATEKPRPVGSVRTTGSAKNKQVVDGVPAGTKLTVIIRDDAPLINCGDVPTYRRVTIGLYANQVEAMLLKPTCKRLGDEIFESVSKCFFE